jgi:hypothetical protein
MVKAAEAARFPEDPEKVTATAAPAQNNRMRKLSASILIFKTGDTLRSSRGYPAPQKRFS